MCFSHRTTKHSSMNSSEVLRNKWGMLSVTRGRRKKKALITSPSLFYSIFFTQSLINNYLLGMPPLSKATSKASALLGETEGQAVIHVRVDFQIQDLSLESLNCHFILLYNQ